MESPPFLKKLQGHGLDALEVNFSWNFVWYYLQGQELKCTNM